MRPRHLRQRAEPADNGRRQFVGVENSWVLPEGFPKDNDGRIDILCEATYIRSTSQHRGLEITTPALTLTPNSYFINYRNGVAQRLWYRPDQ
ncbi:putative dehydrogenase [Salmonella enterica subsp. enterica]|uniref:Putative dehydrogenase n=1 Tax=Salmonella enterica I TaxID=59201 RepID=A0A3S4IQZ9_SALET|nr:putative dehydrogenase [Salmonella enterica subsp. enterica]